MEKRALIAIVLSLAVLVGYQFFFVKKPPPQEAPPVKAVEDRAAERPMEPFVPPAPSAGRLEEKTVSVENSLYTAVFSSSGGTLKTFVLKNYLDKDGLHISLLKEGEIVKPLSVGWDDGFSLSNEEFEIIGGDIELSSENPTGTLELKYEAPNISVKRTLTFYWDKYKIDLTDETRGLPAYQITLGTGFGIHESEEDGGYTHVGPVVLIDADRKEIKTGKLKGKNTYTGAIKWIVREDKYFFSSLVPLSKVNEASVGRRDGSSVVSFMAGPGENRFILYAGPKEHDRLKELGLGLEHVIDFGFFSVIARPIFWLLKKIFSVIGNYGWAIVLLTIIIRIPFIPVTNIMQRSMKKLKDLQPRMQEIREKYQKKDPQRMYKEMMELQKKHKVNPMSGCLPLLLQIPVFFALYKVLLIAIELRGAPFVLWITDLSQKDPYYVLPIVMGVTMVLQQKMTPAGDPKQQKLMMLMPVVFTFLFLNFASGLVLYWLVNNVLAIAQQLYTNVKDSRSA